MGKEDVNASDSLKEAMMRLNEKLCSQLNGEVVNDTFVRHVKKTVEKIVENHEMMDNLVKLGLPQDASDWMLYVFAVMQSGSLTEEEMTDEFRQGMVRFIEEHDLEKKYEESKKKEE